MKCSSQVTAPQASPKSEIEQVIGLTKVEVDYARPAKKGRLVFGDLVPYGKVWRTGANENTIVSFSDDIIIDGQKLPKGEYALYTLPKADAWEVMFYNDTKNWDTCAWDIPNCLRTKSCLQDDLRTPVLREAIQEDPLNAQTLIMDQTTLEERYAEQYLKKPTAEVLYLYPLEEDRDTDKNIQYAISSVSPIFVYEIIPPGDCMKEVSVADCGKNSGGGSGGGGYPGGGGGGGSTPGPGSPGGPPAAGGGNPPISVVKPIKNIGDLVKSKILIGQVNMGQKLTNADWIKKMDENPEFEKRLKELKNASISNYESAYTIFNNAGSGIQFRKNIPHLSIGQPYQPRPQEELALYLTTLDGGTYVMKMTNKIKMKAFYNYIANDFVFNAFDKQLHKILIDEIDKNKQMLEFLKFLNKEPRLSDLGLEFYEEISPKDHPQKNQYVLSGCAEKIRKEWTSASGKIISPGRNYLSFCDVHSGNVARTLGILKRTQNDQKALQELDTSLRGFDSADPVK
ncbi:hypothetical protein FQR65_LT17364 [Abscondita terminalis]|nr:hypothetical protein FQR65_LT17364 [Abscondita terminalis]